MKKLGQALTQKFRNAPVGAKLRLVCIGFVVASAGIGAAIGADIPTAIVAGTLLFATTGYVYVLGRRSSMNHERVGSKP